MVLFKYGQKPLKCPFKVRWEEYFSKAGLNETEIGPFRNAMMTKV
jgi:hypothetical protein